MLRFLLVAFFIGTQACTDQSHCFSNLPLQIFLNPGDSHILPLNFNGFDPSCLLLPSDLHVEFSLGLYASVSENQISISASISFTGKGFVYINWTSLQQDCGYVNISCVCTCESTPIPTPTPTPTLTLSPTTNTCQNGPLSNCFLDIPNSINMCSCETQRIFYNFSSCNINVWKVDWSTSSKVHITYHNSSDGIEFLLSADIDTNVDIWIYFEWCDSTGSYGVKNTTCSISPPPSTSTTSVIPTITPTNSICQPTNESLSKCVPNVGNIFIADSCNISIVFNCLLNWIEYDWALSIPGCNISSHLDTYLNPIYSIQCEVSILQKNFQGIIQTKWCDHEGFYGIWTFMFNLEATALIIPSSSNPSSCQNKTSNCKVIGPKLVTIVEGHTETFSLYLQCPVYSCETHTHWTATFQSCLVSVNYKDVNPTYIIQAPYGTAGQGGIILTEWCDDVLGYTSFTTNFIIINSTASQNYTQVQNNLLSSGQFQSASTTSVSVGSSNWKHTRWVIALLTLFLVLLSLFLLAIGRLLWKRCKRIAEQKEGVPNK